MFRQTNVPESIQTKQELKKPTLMVFSERVKNEKHMSRALLSNQVNGRKDSRLSHIVSASGKKTIQTKNHSSMKVLAA